MPPEAIKEEVMKNIIEGETKIESESEKEREEEEGKQNEDDEEENEREPEEEKELKDGSNLNRNRREAPIPDRMDPMYPNIRTSNVGQTQDRQPNNRSIQEESKYRRNDMEPIVPGKDTVIVLKRNNPNLPSINEENKEEVSRSQLGSMAEIVECEECHNIITEELKVLNGRDVCDSCYTRLNRKQNDD